MIASAMIKPAEGLGFENAGVVIVGAGAAGLCAALRAAEAGVPVVVIERDRVPAGSTALSAGLIPAAGTRFQRAKGIADRPQLFAEDILAKSHGEADPALVRAVSEGAAPTVEWLADRYSFPFEVIDNFNYPGHSAFRMHGLPSRSGVELIDRLRTAAEQADIPILTNSVVTTLYAEAGGRIAGIGCRRGDADEQIGCDALILACNGFGGNRQLVERHIPEIAAAIYFGHAGNQGDAILWGQELGADIRCLSAYQGHGSVATPHNVLITWACISEGGFQVNREGRRFANEGLGYSEHAAEVMRQPGGIAYEIFDERIAKVAHQFPDFRDAENAGALLRANTIENLGQLLDIPAAALTTEFEEIACAMQRGVPDRFGRSFKSQSGLTPPYRAIKVTGALFHTQGGLMIAPETRVVRPDRVPFPNLFAAGGAAVGVSGKSASGYLSGNGLLTATVLGRLAGEHAAGLARDLSQCQAHT
jgi:fumarate reductase flavoprotein subunit